MMKWEENMKKTCILSVAIMLLLNNIVSAQRSGRPMSTKDRWDSRYAREMYIYGKGPTAFLKQKIAMVRKGKALVLAMGEGRNAVYLAQNGFDVTGVDISEVAIEKCKKLADESNTKVNTVVADLTDYDMGKAQYDLITNFNLLIANLLALNSALNELNQLADPEYFPNDLTCRLGLINPQDTRRNFV